MDKRLESYELPKSFEKQIKELDLRKYTPAGDQAITKEQYNSNMKHLPLFIRPVMKSAMNEYLINKCIRCDDCKNKFNLLVYETKSKEKLCYDCTIKQWNDGSDPDLNQWASKHLQYIHNDKRFNQIFEVKATMGFLMKSMLFLVKMPEAELQDFVRRAKKDSVWGTKYLIEGISNEEKKNWNNKKQIYDSYAELASISTDRWNRLMEHDYMQSVLDSVVDSMYVGKGSIRNKIMGEYGNDKPKAIGKMLTVLNNPWNMMEQIEIGKKMEEAMPVFKKKNATTVYSLLLHRLTPYLSYKLYMKHRTSDGDYIQSKIAKCSGFTIQLPQEMLKDNKIHVGGNLVLTHRQAKVRDWEMISALGNNVKDTSIIGKKCLEYFSQQCHCEFDIRTIVSDPNNSKISMTENKNIIEFFELYKDFMRNWKNITHYELCIFPYNERGMTQNMWEEVWEHIHIGSDLKYAKLRKEYEERVNDFYTPCDCKTEEDFLVDENDQPISTVSNDNVGNVVNTKVIVCKSMKQRNATRAWKKQDQEKNIGSEGSDPSDLGTNILGQPQKHTELTLPIPKMPATATPINARQMTFEEAKEYLKFKNLSLISSQQFVEVIRDTRELHTKKRPIMLSTFHILQTINHRKDLEKDEPVYIPKDPRKAYRPDYDRLGSTHFWGDLLGYTPKATTKEMIIEFCDWTLDNLELLLRLPRAEREGLFELHGFIKSTDEFVRTTIAKIYNAEIETINEIRQSVEDHYAKLNVNTTQTEKVKKKQTAQTPVIATGRTKPTTHQKLMIDDDMFSVTQILRSNGKLIPDDAEPTKYKVWLDLFVKQIWKDALMDEAKIFDEVKKSKEFLKDEFRQDIRMQWLKEYEEVKGITIPESHSHRPKLNQLYGVYIVRKQNKLFCMDRTGSGKTLMAILSAIDSNSRFCLVVCPVNIAEQWKIEIRKALPHAMITGGSDKHGFDTDTNVNPDYDLKKNIPMRRFHIVNFDKFSRNTKRTRAMIEGLRNKTPDMIIIDEAQNVKINDDYTANEDLVQSKRKNDNISTRRKNIEGLVSSQRKKKELQNNEWVNKNLPPRKSKKFESRKNQLEKSAKKNEMKLIFLSATPMINTLSEAKSLIRLLTGEDYAHLKQWNSQKNASLMFMEFQPFSMRSTKSFNVNVHGLNPEEAIETDIRPKFTKHPDDMTFLDWEVIATEARLPEIIRAIGNRKTIIYTHYVGNGLVEMIKKACEKAGIKCGYFIGVDPKRGMYKEEAKGGLIDYTKKNPDGSYFNPFTQGDTQVVIASQSLAEGFDGLQGTCNNLILNGIPWTYAEIEQIVGRLDREGQTAKKVDVHMLFAKICGYQYDRKVKWNRVDLKRQYANIVVDGRLEDKEDTLVDIKAKAKVRLGDMIKHIKDMSEKTVGGINDTI